MEFKSKRSSGRSDLLLFLDQCNQEILKKSCILDKEMNSCCVGDNHYESDTFDSAVTSTPNIKKAGLSRKSQDLKRQENAANQKHFDTASSKAVSVSKVLSIIESKRREDTVSKHKAAIIAREKQMLQERVSDQAQLQALSQAKALKLHEEQLQLLKEEEALAVERKVRQELQQQRHAQRVSRRDEQIKAAELQMREAEAERRKNLAEKLKYTEEFQHYLSEFSEVYNKINLEFKSCQSLSPLVNEVKPLNASMQSLIQRMKSMEVNQSDVLAARDICVRITLIYANVLEEVVKLRKKSEEIEANKQQELSQPHAIVTQPSGINSVSSEVVKDSVNELSDSFDKESLVWYQELRKFKESNERLFDQLLKDDSLKKYRFDCQKAVNIPVNAISPVSASHLRDKLHKLTLLLSGQPVVIGDGVRVSASQHPAGIPFCKDLLAKKFVRQGASTVSSKPEAAFAIAAVMVALWQEFPDWGRLLLAHFHQECPYLVPVFWPQLEGQSNRDYYLSLGYTYNEDGEVEKQDKFLKRMSGMMRLYSAVVISRLPRDRQNRPHPHDLGQGWRWLTCILNLEPRPDICATLLYDFLEVAGCSMSQQYGRQYRKLLLVICKGYFPRLQKSAVSSSGPVVRLETFLQTILKQGGSRPPLGMLPVNFW